MANVRTALEVAIALRAALETDTALRITITDLCERAILLLVGTRQFAEEGGPLLAYQYKKLNEQVAYITYILRRALCLLTRVRETRALSRFYDGADLSADAEQLTCDLSRTASLVQGLLSTRLLDIAAQNRSTIDDLHSVVTQSLKQAVADPDRLRRNQLSPDTPPSGSTSTSGFPPNDVQRVYLEQKISLLAESLIVTRLSPTIPPLATTASAESSPMSPDSATLRDGDEPTEFVPETFELLDSLRSSITPFELADRLRALFLGVSANFDLAEAALSIILVEIGLRRRLLLADNSQQSIVMLARSLIHLSLAYTRLERYSESICAVEEADILLRGLMANEPECGPSEVRLLFAEHLLGRGVRLYGVGRFKESVASCEEAEVQWSLAMQGDVGTQTDSLTSQLLRSILVRCGILHSMDRFEECVPALINMRDHSLQLCSTQASETETFLCGALVLSSLAMAVPPPEALYLVEFVHQALSRVPNPTSHNPSSLHSTVWFSLSHAHFALNQLESALLAVQTAINLCTPETDHSGTPCAAKADEITYWMYIQHATILFRLGDSTECREVLTKTFRLFDQVAPARRALVLASLADALELSAALRSREEGHRGTLGEMEAELEKAAVCWQELTGEMELRAGKGLTRVSAALWELRHSTPSPPETCAVAKATKDKDTHRKWKQKLAGKLKQAENRLRSR